MKSRTLSYTFTWTESVIHNHPPLKCRAADWGLVSRVPIMQSIWDIFWKGLFIALTAVCLFSRIKKKSTCIHRWLIGLGKCSCKIHNFKKKPSRFSESVSKPQHFFHSNLLLIHEGWRKPAAVPAARVSLGFESKVYMLWQFHYLSFWILAV